MKVFNINLSLSSLIKIRINNNNKFLTLLVDTGANISLLKYNYKYNVNKSNKTNITGIGQGTIQSIGQASIDLLFDNFIIEHDFQIVHNEFPIPCDGIIGLNFSRKFNCQIDYQNNEFIINPSSNKYQIHVPLVHSYIDNSILLPARSEVMRKIIIQFDQDTVPIQEIHPRELIVNSVVASKTAIVRILNTTNKIVKIEKP